MFTLITASESVLCRHGGVYMRRGVESYKSFKLFGELVPDCAACESGLHNEIHGLVDLQLVI